MGVGIEPATIYVRPERYRFPDVHASAESNHRIDPIDFAEAVATLQQRTVKAQIAAHVIIASACIE